MEAIDFAFWDMATQSDLGCRGGGCDYGHELELPGIRSV